MLMGQSRHRMSPTKRACDPGAPILNAVEVLPEEYSTPAEVPLMPAVPAGPLLITPPSEARRFMESRSANQPKQILVRMRPAIRINERCP